MRQAGIKLKRRKEGISRLARGRNKCVHSLGHNLFSNYIKISRGFHSAVQCLLVHREVSNDLRANELLERKLNQTLSIYGMCLVQHIIHHSRGFDKKDLLLFRKIAFMQLHPNAITVKEKWWRTRPAQKHSGSFECPPRKRPFMIWFWTKTPKWLPQSPKKPSKF